MQNKPNKAPAKTNDFPAIIRFLLLISRFFSGPAVGGFPPTCKSALQRLFDAAGPCKVSDGTPATLCYHTRMYFVGLKPLKEDLAGTGLNEKERLKYLVVWFIPQVVAVFAQRGETAGPKGGRSLTVI